MAAARWPRNPTCRRAIARLITPSLLKPLVDPARIDAFVRVAPGLFSLELPGDQLLIDVQQRGAEALSQPHDAPLQPKVTL